MKNDKRGENMKNKVKKIFLMILLCNIVVLIVPFYTHAAQKGWVKVGKTYRYRVQSSYVKNRVKKIKGKYYYFDKKGLRKSGWVNYKGHRYYFDKKTGEAYVGKHKIKKNSYIFRKTGRLVVKTGEYRQGNKKYFIGETGKVLIGNRKIKGKWYYFDGQGNKEELPTKHTIESGIITTNLETSQLKRQTLDGYHLQNCNKLMIVAHPDDESLWGGGHLLDKGYFGEYGHIQHRMTSKLVTEVYRCNYKGLNRLYYFGKYYKWNQLSQVENGLISLSKDKLNRKIQIINTVYKSQDVKWDRHMMKYENWIAFQDWKEKN